MFLIEGNPSIIIYRSSTPIGMRGWMLTMYCKLHLTSCLCPSEYYTNRSTGISVSWRRLSLDKTTWPNRRTSRCSGAARQKTMRRDIHLPSASIVHISMSLHLLSNYNAVFTFPRWITGDVGKRMTIRLQQLQHFCLQGLSYTAPHLI